MTEEVLCKADKLLEEANITQEKYVELNEKLSNTFTDANEKSGIRVVVGSRVGFNADRYVTMERTEAISMARWILTMLEDT